jgi:hypothetical protein
VLEINPWVVKQFVYLIFSAIFYFLVVRWGLGKKKFEVGGKITRFFEIFHSTLPQKINGNCSNLKMIEIQSYFKL